MRSIDLEIEPGEVVNYSDIQFGNLEGAKLDHVRVHTFGMYAVIQLNGITYTVPYGKLLKAT